VKHLGQSSVGTSLTSGSNFGRRQHAHPTATSLEHHIELTPDRKIAGLRIGPDYEQYADTLLLAVCSLLVALDGFLERFGDVHERRELAELCAGYRQAHGAD
jgi:hypothetical protein